LRSEKDIKAEVDYPLGVPMAVLSDHEIVRYLIARGLKIAPFSEKNLTPNGYDMTIGEIEVPSRGLKVTEGEVIIRPGEWFLLSTLEEIRLPPELTGQIWLRTTYIRRGFMGSFGRIDAGFHGTLTLALANMSPKEQAVTIGDRIVQVVFETLSTLPEKVYAERSGNYQGQLGITREPIKKK